MTLVKTAIAKQLGEQVRKLRKEHQLTQEELAARSAISLKYIQKIESKNPPNLGLEYVEKLAKGLELKPWELLKF